DVAAVGRLELDQPARAVDAEIDAVARHPELERTSRPWAIVAPAAAGWDQQRMWPLAFEHLAERVGPDRRLVVGQARVVDRHDPFGAVPRRFGSRLPQPVPEHKRDVRPAELACELAALRQELER